MLILSGQPIKDRLENDTLKIVHQLRQDNIIPHLAVILVGHNEDSELYVAIKQKRAHELGMDFSLYRFDEDETAESVIETIKYLNNDDSIHGLIVQLPLPDNLDTDQIISAIDPKKDVDDLTKSSQFLSPSPQAIVEIIDEYKIDTQDKKIVIVGHGRLVGAPLENLLKERQLDVQAVDDKTEGLIEKIKSADIIIAATGTDGIITEELAKKDSVVISVGREANYDRLKDHVSALTPVKGGVGPITVALLLKNTAQAAEKTTHSQ